MEDGQNVIAPFALFGWLVDFPDVVEIGVMPGCFVISEQAVERFQKDHALLHGRLVQQIEDAGWQIVEAFQFTGVRKCRP
jgi:hypothetical protein